VKQGSREGKSNCQFAAANNRERLSGRRPWTGADNPVLFRDGWRQILLRASFRRSSARLPNLQHYHSYAAILANRQAFASGLFVVLDGPRAEGARWPWLVRSRQSHGRRSEPRLPRSFGLLLGTLTRNDCVRGREVRTRRNVVRSTLSYVKYVIAQFGSPVRYAGSLICLLSPRKCSGGR
jgi:hypothetical protein